MQSVYPSIVRTVHCGPWSPFLLHKKRPKASGALNYYCVWQVINFISHD
jgi:hypothetical protein